jgi:ankyrin repeat protein
MFRSSDFLKILIESPLGEVVVYGDLALVRSLLDGNADAMEFTEDDSTVLHNMALRTDTGIRDIIPLLCDRVGPAKRELLDQENKLGKTVLHDAAYHGNDLFVKVLLATKATVDVEDHARETPLFCAVAAGHHSIVQELMMYKADLKKVNNVGHMPVRYCPGTRECEDIRTWLLNPAGQEWMAMDDEDGEAAPDVFKLEL